MKKPSVEIVLVKFIGNRRQRKGITLSDAKNLMRERNYFAAMMVNEDEADALITGYSRPYPSVVKPILELDRKRYWHVLELPLVI